MGQKTRTAKKWVLPNKPCVEVKVLGKEGTGHEVVRSPPDVLIKMQGLCQHLMVLGSFTTPRQLTELGDTEDPPRG